MSCFHGESVRPGRFNLGCSERVRNPSRVREGQHVTRKGIRGAGRGQASLSMPSLPMSNMPAQAGVLGPLLETRDGPDGGLELSEELMIYIIWGEKAKTKTSLA